MGIHTGILIKEGRAGTKPGPYILMIQVTRLNGTAFTLNALYIEKIESFPDTTITMTTGTKYIVHDSVEEVHNRVIEFYKTVQLLSNPHVGGIQDEK